MAHRKMTHSINYLVMGIMVLAILGLVNFLSARHFARADLTANKEFTISQASKDILAGLNDPLWIKVYFSQKLPSYMLNVTERIRDLLDEYQAYGHGNLQVQWINPDRDEITELETGRLGIQKVQLQIIEKDRQEMLPVFMGLAAFFEDRKEVIPVVSNITNLEYDISSMILKVTNLEQRMIGIAASPETTPEGAGITQIRGELGRQYGIRDVDLRSGHAVPDTIDTLLVFNPTELDEGSRFQLDQYLMRGKNVIAMIDPIIIETETMTAKPHYSGLDDMLAFYGVKINQDLVSDVSCDMATFRTGFGMLRTQYSLWPLVTRKAFAESNPAVNRLEALVLPWCGRVELIEDKLEGREVTVLAQSSPQAWLMKDGNYRINPQQRPHVNPNEFAQFPLIAMLSGSFDSFYQGKPEPEPAVEDESPPVSKSEKPPRLDSTLEGKTSRLVVIPNANFVRDQFAMFFRSRDNATFLQNLVDWMTLGEELIQIRSRTVTMRPLKEIEESTKQVVKYLNMFGISILVIIFGLARSAVRRRRSRNRSL